MTIDWFAVQQRLKALGFDPGPSDGLPGPRTNSALVAFKRSIGLRARPYLGPITHEALFAKQGEVTKSNLPWMAEALRMRGLHEARNVTELRRWFDRSVSWIDPREVAWCGAFVATCVRNFRPNETLPENPLGARNWASYGITTAPVFGSILTFWRGSPSGWKGHVGFYFGEDDAAFHVLGGNQSNAVTVTRIAKSRFLKARWPAGVDITGRRVVVSRGGVPLSRNEA